MIYALQGGNYGIDRHKFSVWRGAVSFLSEENRQSDESVCRCGASPTPFSLQIPEKREASDRERPFWDTASRDWPSQPSERQKLTLSTTITTAAQHSTEPMVSVRRHRWVQLPGCGKYGIHAFIEAQDATNCLLMSQLYVNAVKHKYMHIWRPAINKIKDLNI